MWQKFRKREEPIKIYKDKGEPALDHLPRTAVDGVISWEPVSMHWNIIVSSSGNDAMLSVTARMSRRERSCKDVIVTPHPTPPHPTPPHLETMPSWVWPQVCQRKERSCQDVIVPPHPTPPPRIWRRCHVECGRKCDADFGFRIARMVVAESSFFGCGIGFGFGIVFFWLRNRLFWLRKWLFLVAEASFFGCGIVFFGCGSGFFGCGSVSVLGCGLAEIWLRKRRNMVAESDFIQKPRYQFKLTLWQLTPIDIYILYLSIYPPKL